MKTINTVGVVGAGTMGAALAQKFAQQGFRVILGDRSAEFVERGLNSIRASLKEGLRKKVFTIQQVEDTLRTIKGTGELREMSDCDLVIEAIYEDFRVKSELFRQLSEIVPAETILATNTSSFSITELSSSVTKPERFVGLHFFYHAAKNRLVEIIPGKQTSEATIELMKEFSFMAGKDPITCADAYGFVVNRFFVPWLNESVRLLEEKVGTMEEIDAVCRRAFGIGMGPFALMNATGVPVAYHSEKTLEVFGELYHVAKALKVQAESNQLWALREIPETLVDPAKEKSIRERMLGVIFFVCSQLLEEKVCTATEINQGALIGLKWKKGPCDLMCEAGEQAVNAIVQGVAQRYNMRVPEGMTLKNWNNALVTYSRRGKVGVIKLNQPQSMNALGEQSMQQLSECLTIAENDANIQTIMLTGSGKAFVAGADIRFFLKNMKGGTICEIEKFTESGQEIFERIDKSEKKVVAIVNGLTLGGGLELALCADVILSLPTAQFAFPETGIGIYPGLGGTQRSVRKFGKGLSKYLIHTGKMISAKQAEEIGLVDKIITVPEMFALLNGVAELPEMKPRKLNPGWTILEKIFETNSLEKIRKEKIIAEFLGREEEEKILRSLSRKAPVAIRLADKLIDEAKGCQSELAHLREIFSTSDALLGLSSIGKEVHFEGK